MDTRALIASEEQAVLVAASPVAKYVRMRVASNQRTSALKAEITDNGSFGSVDCASCKQGPVGAPADPADFSGEVTELTLAGGFPFPLAFFTSAFAFGIKVRIVRL